MKQEQQSLLDTSQDFLFNPEEQNRVSSVGDFIIERHKIYLRKNVEGMKKPWTSDPMLQSYRFCNIYRQLDTVSMWINDNIIEPYERHPNLWFMLAIARLINWPDTLQELMDRKVWPVDDWNPKRFYEALVDRKDRKEKIITGAYIINSVFPKGFDAPDKSKIYYIPYVGLDPLFQNREELSRACKSTMAKAVESLKKNQGWGAFMAYQVIVDLSYSDRWLRRAEDFNSYTSPGPGTTRGMNRLIYGGRKNLLNGDKLNEPMIKARKEINRYLKETVPEEYWTGDFRTGFSTLEMSNVSNSFCEYDKYVRLISGQGEPRSRYAGR